MNDTKELTDDQKLASIQSQRDSINKIIADLDRQAADIVRMQDEEEYVWKVTVTDELLTFTKVEKPIDWALEAIEQPYTELNGTYLGNRGFYDVQFSLHRNLKASDFYSGYCGSVTKYKDPYGNFSLREWRIAHGFGYAWQPQGYFKYKDQLYTPYINFL